MSALWPTIGWYCVFSFFVFQQQLHSRRFRGGSAVYGVLLSLFGFIGMLAGLLYLGWLAYFTHWWAPILAFIAGSVVAGTASGILRSDQSLAITGLVGFVAAPITGYLMFSAI